MKLQQKKLLDKLLQIDERLVNIWIQDDLDLSDEEIWDLFVVLLETRVGLLKTCREAGVPLSREAALPGWLEDLVASRKEVRLREIKQLAQDLKRRRQVLAYEIKNAPEGSGHIDESV